MATIERDAATMRVIEELKRLYKLKILPLEQTHRYDIFQQPHMTDAEFVSKPQVTYFKSSFSFIFVFDHNNCG